MSRYVLTVLVTAKAEEARPVIDEHRAYLEGLRGEGNLFVTGEFRQGDGFLTILEGVDRLQAEALTRASPLVRDGLASWSLRAWDVSTGRV